MRCERSIAFVSSQVDLNHKSGQIVVKDGIDLTDYYKSIEWDILAVVSARQCFLRTPEPALSSPPTGTCCSTIAAKTIRTST